jgi:hypothetical protein
LKFEKLLDDAALEWSDSAEQIGDRHFEKAGAHNIGLLQSVGMESLGDGDTTHPSGPGGIDSVDGIFNDYAVRRSLPKFGCRTQEYVRRWLFVGHFLAPYDGIPILRRQSYLPQVCFNFNFVRAGCDGDPEPRPFASGNQIGRAGKCPQLSWNQFEIDFVRSRFGARQIELKMVFLCDAANVSVFAGANEGKKIFGLNREAIFFEHRNGGSVDERFGIGKDSVHVEDYRANVARLVRGI